MTSVTTQATSKQGKPMEAWASGATTRIGQRTKKRENTWGRVTPMLLGTMPIRLWRISKRAPVWKSFKGWPISSHSFSCVRPFLRMCWIIRISNQDHLQITHSGSRSVLFGSASSWRSRQNRTQRIERRCKGPDSSGPAAKHSFWAWQV